MNIKSWDSLKRILKVKTLQCQGYVNINDLTSRVSLSLWHYNCFFFWSLIFRAQLCALTTRRLHFNDVLEWFFFHLWKIFHLWIISHLWIFFIGGSFSFIKRHFVIHSFLKWISIIKRTSLFNFNFFFFFLQRWWMFNRFEINCDSSRKKRDYYFFRKKLNY